MNYLAHLYLAKDSDELLVGNFIGDFVKGKLGNRYAENVRRGIVLHRKIDSFTDSHPVFKQSKRLISRKRRKYAGVMIDIFFDHLLSVNWKDYSDEPLEIFIRRVCTILEKNESDLPVGARNLLSAIKDRDWLGRYRNIYDLRGVFEGLSSRVKRQNPLRGSEEELIINYNGFSRNFEIFFPELIYYTDNIKEHI